MIAYASYFTDARIKKYVSSLLKAGHEVDVFAVGASEQTERGLTFFSLMPKSRSKSALPYLMSYVVFFLTALLRVSIAGIQRRYQLVHIHNMPNFLVFAAVVPKLLGARIILDVHDTMPETYATKFQIPLTHFVIRVLCLEERISAEFADVVLCTNVLHREVLIRRGIKSDKVTVIMNAADTTLFVPRPRAAKFPDLTLGYHGTIAGRLGIDLILEALALSRSQCPGLRFVLIGDGDEMPWVRRRIEELDLGGTVVLRGWVPVEQLPRYLESVDVGVVGMRRDYDTSKNWALPVKMLEYAAMEIPTIAPKLRAITAYFDDTSAMLYEADDVADLARCIKVLYTRREIIQTLVLGLRVFNSKYSWWDMESEYMRIVKGLARIHGGAPD